MDNLNINLRGVTDAGLENLREMSKLQSLWLTDSQVTGSGWPDRGAGFNLKLRPSPRLR